MEKEAFIEIKNVSKVFGRSEAAVYALRDINLEIY